MRAGQGEGQRHEHAVHETDGDIGFFGANSLAELRQAVEHLGQRGPAGAVAGLKTDAADFGSRG
jgi:hypothetical protein